MVWKLPRLREELRFLSLRKLYNLLLEQMAPRLRLARLPHAPTRITVESGNVCNLRCPLCPTGQRDPSAAKGLLPYQTFEKILDQLGRDLITVRLYNWGEPLLNKDLVRMCELAYRRKVSVKKIYVSADGATPESYARYRRGGDFRKVVENMRMLAEKKRELGNRFTRVIWLFHVFRHNEDEIGPARRLARQIGVELQINRARTDMSKEIFETVEEALDRDGHWLPEGDEFCAYDREKSQAQRASVCHLPWRDTAINWDGSVLPCCSVYSEKHAFGNIHQRPFRSIWNGALYRDARREILGRGETLDTICKTCKKNGYLFL